MTDERWPRVKALFQAAVERPIEERDAFLAAATGDDAALRREVESLLTSDASDVSFLDRLPVASESVLADPLAALPASMDHTPSHTVLTAGLRVGPYEIVAPLGAGGMGEVYRARDTKLERDVAIKVLPERFAGDPDRLARFKREAQLLAALNHPNIARDLRPRGVERRRRRWCWSWSKGRRSQTASHSGRFRCDEALAIARQIAEALEAAHEQGHHPPRSQAGEHQDRAPTAWSRCWTSGWRRCWSREPRSAELSRSPTLTAGDDAARGSSSAPPPT